MRLFIDLDTLTLVAGPNDRRIVSQIQAKRGDHLPVELQFLRNGQPVRLPASTVLTFGAKPLNEFDADAVVLDAAFTQSAAPGDPEDFDDVKWTGTPSLNTAELNALFLIDGNPANDPAFIDLSAEFTWIADGDDGPTTIRTVTFRVANDVVRGDEGTPTELPTPDDYVAARAVLYDRAQSLTSGQQAQARANMNAASAPVVSTLSLRVEDLEDLLGAEFATLTIANAAGSSALVVTATTPGEAGNDITITRTIATTAPDRFSPPNASRTGDAVTLTYGDAHVMLLTTEPALVFELDMVQYTMQATTRLTYHAIINDYPSYQATVGAIETNPADPGDPGELEDMLLRVTYEYDSVEDDVRYQLKLYDGLTTSDPLVLHWVSDGSTPDGTPADETAWSPRVGVSGGIASFEGAGGDLNTAVSLWNALSAALGVSFTAVPPTTNFLDSEIESPGPAALNGGEDAGDATLRTLAIQDTITYTSPTARQNHARNLAPPVVAAHTTTTKTLAAADLDTLIPFSNASGCAITIPTGLGSGAETIYLHREPTAGALTLSHAGVTVANAAAISTVAAGGTCALKRRSANHWILI